ICDTINSSATPDPSGAVKTSIIDAMTYALYGCTPRLNEKQAKDLISQGMSRATVLFRFSAGKEQYRIARAGRWTGRNLVTELRLEHQAGSDWVMLADSVTKGQPIAEQIIGLDFSGLRTTVHW